MDDATNLTPGTPVFTADRHEIGYVAEVREDAFRVNVPARPDYWLALEDVRTSTDVRVDLRIREDEIGEHKVAEPVRSADGSELANEPLIGPSVRASDGEPGDPYLDVERYRMH